MQIQTLCRNRIITGLGIFAFLLTSSVIWLWTPDLDRVALESQYAPPPSQFVELSGVRVHLRSSGPTILPPATAQSKPAPESVPTVVLLHGFGSSLHTWESWVPVLSQDFRVIRYDLPGNGLTGPDPSGDYTDARGVVVLLDLLNHLGIHKISLVGHSIGGRLAWKFAASHPERIDKLVLIAPDGFASPGFEYGKPPEVGLSLQAMRFVLPKNLLRMSLEPAYANASAMTDQLLTRYHDLMRAPGVRPALISRLEQSTLQDPKPILANIKVQTLLLWGEQDAMIPVAHAGDYLHALPNAQLVRMPGVGHLPQEEAPAESVRSVHQFLH